MSFSSDSETNFWLRKSCWVSVSRGKLCQVTSPMLRTYSRYSVFTFNVFCNFKISYIRKICPRSVCKVELQDPMLMRWFSLDVKLIWHLISFILLLSDLSKYSDTYASTIENWLYLIDLSESLNLCLLFLHQTKPICIYLYFIATLIVKANYGQNKNYLLHLLLYSVISLWPQNMQEIGTSNYLSMKH